MARRSEKPKRPKISNEDLLNDLKRVSALNNDRYVSKLHYEELGKYNVKTLVARFGNWSKTLDQLGLINHKDDIIGERFGMLEVIGATNEKYFNYWLWECRCDCGNICYRTSSALRGDNSYSCGCQMGLGESLKHPEKFDYIVQEGFESHRHESGLLYINYLTIRSDNKTGYTGVARYKTSKGYRYMAELRALGVKHRLFGFHTAEEAYLKGRLVLEKEHFPEDFLIELNRRRKEKEDHG